MSMLGFPRKLVSAQRDLSTPTYFQPATYGTPYFWHRADDPADGVVSEWRDRSSAGQHLGIIANANSSAWYAARDARRLRTLVAPMTFLRSLATPGTGATARTIVCVAQIIPATSPPAAQTLWGYGTNSSAQALQLDVASGVYRVLIPAVASTTAAAFSTTLPDVTIMTYDGTTLTFYVNGASAYSGAQALNTGTSAPFTAGMNIGGTNPGRVAYYELAAWNAAVNATQAGEINAVLQAQYQTGR